MNPADEKLKKDLLKYSFFLSLLYLLAVYLPVNFLSALNFDDVDVLTRMQGHYPNFPWVKIFFTNNLIRYYRPLLEVLCYLDYIIWGGALSAWHLTNYILHMLNAVLIYLIACAWFGSEKNYKAWACVAMLLFAVNPMACESVAWISGRSDLAGTFFCLTAVWAYLLKSRFKYIITPVAILAGLLCKENALAVIPIIALLEALQQYRKGLKASEILKGCLLWAALVCVPLIIYVLFRTNGLENQTYVHAKAVAPMVSEKYQFDMEYIKSVLNLAPVSAFYMKKLFVPFPLNFAISRINTSIYISLFLAVTIINIYCLAKKKWALPYFTLLIFISFSPALFIAMGGVSWVSMAERYLYLALSVSAMGLTTFFMYCRKRRIFSTSVVIVVLVSIILSWSVAAFVRQFDFKNDETIWTQTLKTNPDDSNVLFMYGKAVGGIEGQKAYHKALAYPGTFTFKAETHFDIALYESKMGNHKTAVHHLNKALSINSSYRNYLWAATILLNFGSTNSDVLERQYIIKALAYLEKARTIRESAFILSNIAIQLAYLGEIEEAKEIYLKILEKYPNSKYAASARKYLEM